MEAPATCIAISLMSLEKGSLGMRRSVLFWNFLISISALVPALNLLFPGVPLPLPPGLLDTFGLLCGLAGGAVDFLAKGKLLAAGVAFFANCCSVSVECVRNPELTESSLLGEEELRSNVWLLFGSFFFFDGVSSLSFFCLAATALGPPLDPFASFDVRTIFVFLSFVKSEKFCTA